MTPRIAAALLFALAPLPSAAHDLAAAYRGADRAADAVVLVEYVLEKEGRGFGAVGQHSEQAAVGTIVSADGVVVLPSAIFPEDEQEQRTPARPRNFVVRLRTGREVKAELTGRDKTAGFAFLKLPRAESGSWPHVTLTDARPRAGDAVVIVDLLPERYGFAPTFRRATIASLVEKPRPLYDLDAYLQDSSIGVPVMDALGRAIGIVTTDPIGETPGALQEPLRLLGVLSRQKEPGYPMVVPAASLLPLVASPPRNAETAARDRSWLGVTLQPVPRALAEHLRVPKPTGVMVTSVRPGSPAEAAGLKLHDIIRQLDGRPVEALTEDDLPTFIQRVQDMGAGHVARLDAWRDGKEVAIDVTLGAAPPTAVVAQEYRNETLGLVAQDLTMDILMARDLPEDLGGALVSDLETAGQAMVGGLERGDIIQGVNRRSVRNVLDLEAALEEARGEKAAEVVFFVLRDPDTLFIPVKTQW